MIRLQSSHQYWELVTLFKVQVKFHKTVLIYQGCARYKYFLYIPHLLLYIHFQELHTLFLRSWLCSLPVSLAAYARLLLEEEGSLSRSLSLSPNQEKGIQVGMEVIDSAGDRFPPDSSSNSAEPLVIKEKFKCNSRDTNLHVFMLKMRHIL